MSVKRVYDADITHPNIVDDLNKLLLCQRLEALIDDSLMELSLDLDVFRPYALHDCDQFNGGICGVLNNPTFIAGHSDSVQYYPFFTTQTFFSVGNGSRYLRSRR